MFLQRVGLCCCQIALGAILLAGCSSVSGADRLHITTGFTTLVSTYFEILFKEINQRNPELEITFEEVFAERSLMLVNDGINDGECCRIPAVVKSRYPNLIAVPYTFFSIKWVGFSKYDLGISKWEDIKSYNAVTVIGWKLAEKKLAEVQPKSLVVVGSSKQMMTMLEMERAEIGVMGYLSGLKTIKDINASAVRFIIKPLAVSPIFLMLHKKHEVKVPVFLKMLQSLEQDGTLERLYQETTSVYAG